LEIFRDYSYAIDEEGLPTARRIRDESISMRRRNEISPAQTGGKQLKNKVKTWFF
jgi:hypothetical protein